MLSRRSFIQTVAIAGAGALKAYPGQSAFAVNNSVAELYTLSEQLLDEWIESLLKLQVTDKARTKDYGGFYCEADKAIHGRVGDTIYPLLYMADKKKDNKYLDAAMLLYEWMETHVSQPDGSWLNEPVEGSWKGTTVFAAIALAEAMKNHGAVLDDSFKKRLTDRLYKAGEYIHTNFTVQYGNINYPVTGAYGMSLLGTLLGEPKFTQKGKDLADFTRHVPGYGYGLRQGI